MREMAAPEASSRPPPLHFPVIKGQTCETYCVNKWNTFTGKSAEAAGTSQAAAEESVPGGRSSC